MKTFNIQISAEQLDVIKLALELQIGMSESNDIVITENDIEETNMLIGISTTFLLSKYSSIFSI